MSSSAKKVKRIIGALSAAFLTLVLCLVFAEVIIRKIDDYPIFPLRLQERVWVTQFSKTDIAQIARGFVANSSVQLGWFGYRFPNYEKIAPPAKLAAWFEGQAMPFGDAFKIWNTNALEHNLKGNLLNIGEVDLSLIHI